MSPLVVASIFPWFAVAQGWSYSYREGALSPNPGMEVFAAYPEITRAMLPRTLGSGSVFKPKSDFLEVDISYPGYAAIETYARTGGKEAARFFGEEYAHGGKLSRHQALYGRAVSERGGFTGELLQLVKNPDTRASAILALGAGGDSRAIPALIVIASEAPVVTCFSGRRDHAHLAVAALGRLGKAALPALHRALQSPNVHLRGNATAALDRIGSPLSVSPLWDALQRETDPSNRRQYIVALAKLGDTRVLPDLFKIAEDNPGSEDAANALATHRSDSRAMAILRRWAMEGELREPVYARLGFTDLRTHWEEGLRGRNGEVFAINLGTLADPRSIPALAAALETGNYGPMIWALGQIGKPAIPAMVALLDSPDSTLRAKAAMTLWAIGDPSVLPHLDKLAERQPNDARKAKLDLILLTLARKVRVP